MKNILCYGDSNTFGYNPENGGRYPFNERWTGILQNSLEQECRIIEEGCNHRTTVFNDPLIPGKCGLDFLPVCLESHKPLDLVILALGINDTKSRFHASSSDIAKGMEVLVKTVFSHRYGEQFMTPEVLIMSPAIIKAEITKNPLSSFSASSVEKSSEIAEKYRTIAKTNNCRFFDASGVANVSDLDYLHLTRESHRRLGQALAEIISGTKK